MDDVLIKARVTAWYDKAKQEEDPFFQFLCLWICFNAWLDYRSPVAHDGGMVKWLTNQLADESDLMRAYDAMALSAAGQGYLQDLVQETAKASIKDERTKGRKHEPITVKNINDKPSTIWGIYRIRCNLFHGKKRPAEEMARDERLVRCASGILQEWLSALIKGWRTNAGPE